MYNLIEKNLHTLLAFLAQRKDIKLITWYKPLIILFHTKIKQWKIKKVKWWKASVSRLKSIRYYNVNQQHDSLHIALLLRTGCIECYTYLLLVSSARTRQSSLLPLLNWHFQKTQFCYLISDEWISRIARIKRELTTLCNRRRMDHSGCMISVLYQRVLVFIPFIIYHRRRCA